MIQTQSPKAFKAFCLGLAGVTWFGGVCGCSEQKLIVDLADSGWTLDTSSATAAERKPETLADLKAAGWSIEAAALGDVEQTFAAHDAEWLKFRVQFKPGDSLVRLVAPSAYWSRSAGWDGYAIVRSGRIVASFAVVLS